MSFLGIGVGKIELRLNGTAFHPGDTIQGNARLTLNEPVKARGVMAEFWAEKDRSSGKSRHTDILFTDRRQLDSEREYSQYEGLKSYDFSFTVPTGIFSELQFSEGLFGSIMGFFRDMANKNIRWYVSVKLDVPMAIDVSAKQRLTVTPAPQRAVDMK